MLPTGYEYNFLCDRKINFILRALLEKLNILWDDIYVEVGPGWNRFKFDEWLASIKVWPDDLDIYFSSTKKGFDFIEKNGITPNKNKYRFFLLEVNVENQVCYKAKILGKTGQDNTNFGDFFCEMYSPLMTRFSIIVPDESIEGGGDDIVSIVRSILNTY